MAKKHQASGVAIATAAAGPTEPSNTRLHADAEFEHDGAHFTAGYHRVDDVTATAIVAAGKASYAPHPGALPATGEETEKTGEQTSVTKQTGQED